MGISYKDAGVDIEKGDQFVRRIKKFVGETYNDKVVSGVGGFAALYDMGGGRYLASGTDGVGTKLKLAQILNRHDTIGQDLVAMCVNDIICTGAKPLFFLDYLGTGKLEPSIHEQIVKGIALACKESGMVLIGGETAEMPGMYQNGEYDLAGFAVGEVYKEELLTGANLEVGDSLVGIASSGFHSNGYSLIRKLIQETETDLLADALVPTKLYGKLVENLMKNLGPSLKGLAHITGSGFLNIPRMNESMGYEIDSLPSNDELPSIINEVAQRSGLEQAELYRTFNMGVGLVVATDKAEETIELCRNLGESSWILGRVADSFKGIKLEGTLL